MISIIAIAIVMIIPNKVRKFTFLRFSKLFYIMRVDVIMITEARFTNNLI